MVEAHLPSPRVPNEILLAILTLSTPSTLAIFSQVSSTCLQLSSPLLYNDVILRSIRQESMFFQQPDPNPPSSPHLLPYTSRSQTKHLTIDFPVRPNRKALSPFQQASLPTYPSPHLPPSGPLLLDSYSNPHGHSSCQHLLNPTTIILSSFPINPTILMAVKSKPLGDHLLLDASRWTRLREVGLEGFVPAEGPLPVEWAREGGRDLRVTIDLRRIKGKVAPRIVKGSCQKLVESWAKQLSRGGEAGGHRGRIWVATDLIKEDFGVAIEEVRKTCEEGSLVWEELGKLGVEVRELPVLMPPSPIPVEPEPKPEPRVSQESRRRLAIQRLGLARRSHLSNLNSSGPSSSDHSPDSHI